MSEYTTSIALGAAKRIAEARAQIEAAVKDCIAVRAVVIYALATDQDFMAFDVELLTGSTVDAEWWEWEPIALTEGTLTKREDGWRLDDASGKGYTAQQVFGGDADLRIFRFWDDNDDDEAPEC